MSKFGYTFANKDELPLHPMYYGNKWLKWIQVKSFSKSRELFTWVELQLNNNNNNSNNNGFKF